MPKYLNAYTAAQFPADISDGFARPMLGWSAFGPQHLDGIDAACMTSNVWYGKPSSMLAFIEKLAAHYESIKNDVDCDDDYDGVSLGYWEKDGLAMIAEFCVGDGFFEQKSDELNEKSQELSLLLGDGNDNNAGMILTNESEIELDVKTRLTLANFMNSSIKWVLDEAAYSGSSLEGFTDEEKDLLLATLQTEGASQVIAAQSNALFEGRTFVVTGTMAKMDRHTIEMTITNMGGNVSSGISKKTFAIIASPDASPAKLEKAASLGTTIWDETTFIAKAGLPAQTAEKEKRPKLVSKAPNINRMDRVVSSELVTGLAAMNFPDDICDGFVPPKAAWCSMDPMKMLNEVGGSCMSSAVWVGSPHDVMRFADALVLHHKKFLESPDQWNGMLDPDETSDGVAVTYWQNDGVAMCGEFYTWHGIAITRHSDELMALSEKLTPVLFEGNDNHAGALLQNEYAELDVPTRLKLAVCMNRGPTEYVLDMYGEDKKALPGFTDADKKVLEEALRTNPHSQFILRL